MTEVKVMSGSGYVQIIKDPDLGGPKSNLSGTQALGPNWSNKNFKNKKACDFGISSGSEHTTFI
jgi:hypothetical protein